MKGKKEFTSTEFEEIKKLVRKKVNASSEDQKTIRDRIRKIGFYYSDFSKEKDGYTLFDLEILVKNRKITIIEG
jgi:ACT domain-containing protein